jgi:hypothetical protein
MRKSCRIRFSMCRATWGRCEVKVLYMCAFYRHNTSNFLSQIYSFYSPNMFKKYVILHVEKICEKLYSLCPLLHSSFHCLLTTHLCMTFVPMLSVSICCVIVTLDSNPPQGFARKLESSHQLHVKSVKQLRESIHSLVMS